MVPRARQQVPVPPGCGARVQDLTKPMVLQLKPQSSHPISTMGRINRSRKTARERHLHSCSENCGIKILSPMTHTEPISGIVWQGNNITAPINTLWGAALLREQQDEPLPTPGGLSCHCGTLKVRDRRAGQGCASPGDSRCLGEGCGQWEQSRAGHRRGWG